MKGTTEAIRAEKVVKTFGTITALAGVSLNVSWGETLGILGDNGAGKSTPHKDPDRLSPARFRAGVCRRYARGSRLGRRRPCTRHRMRLSGSGARQRAQHLSQHVLEPRVAAPRSAAALGPSRDAAPCSRGLAEIGVDIPSVE